MILNKLVSKYLRINNILFSDIFRHLINPVGVIIIASEQNIYILHRAVGIYENMNSKMSIAMFFIPRVYEKFYQENILVRIRS